MVSAPSDPLLKQFKAWLDKSANQIPPKTALGKAVTYCLNQWPQAIRLPYVLARAGQPSRPQHRAIATMGIC